MPKFKDRITVTVAETVTKERRRIVIEIETPASLFELSELLVREDALEPLAKKLKDTNKTFITNYVQSAKALLRSAAQSAATNHAQELNGIPKELQLETKSDKARDKQEARPYP